jgi:sugar (pentulose or hexulose) kinase
MPADILGREVFVRHVNDAYSRGAAMMGFRALGVEFKFNTDTSEKRYSPSKVHGETYQSLYSIFLRLAEHVSDEFKEIASLQTKPA